MKIALIIDKSEAYLKYKVSEILADWGNSNSEQVENINEPPVSGLFGDAEPSIMLIKDTNKMKETVAVIEKNGNDWLEENYSNGLIITTIIARTSTKKIEKIVKDLGGLVDIPPTAKEGTLTERLVDELNLSNEVRSYLLSYIGDDYETLIPIVRGVKEIPKKLQSKITVEDMYYRLPTPPGAVPPWTIEEHILKGDVTNTIETFRRVHEHQHLLVAISLLKGKFQNYYKLKVLQENYVGDDDIAKILGLKSKGQLYYLKKNVNRLSIENLENIVKILERNEAKAKGAGREPTVALTEKSLVQICQYFKR